MGLNKQQRTATKYGSCSTKIALNKPQEQAKN